MSRRNVWLSLFPVAAWLLVYLVPLGVRPASSPDESRYAVVPYEMITSGDWVVPRLNGLRYFEKPPLGYWMNAVSQELLGPTAFAIRLPAALSAGAVALIVALLLAHAFRDRLVTLVGALATLTMLEVYACGTLNVLDGPFSLWLTATLACAYLALEAEDRRRERRSLILAGVACALAFLTKGFLAFVLPVAVILPYLAWQRRLRSVLRLGWLPVLVTLAVVAPWAWAIASREPDFWRYFVMEQHVRRFGSDKAQHAEPFWYFLPVLLAGGLPWVTLLPGAIKTHLRSGFDSSLVRFAVCWLLFPLLFFSVSKGKLATYVLPCFPPMALLIATAARSLFEEPGARSTRRWSTGLGLLMGLIGLGALIATLPGVLELQAFAGDGGKLRLAGTGFLVWGLLAVLAGRAGRPEGRVLLFAAAPLLLFAVIPFAMPTDVAKRFPSDTIRSIADRIDDQTILVTDRSYMQPMCWELKRSDVLLIGKAGEAAYELEHSDGRRQLTHAELDALLRDPERERAAVCVLDDENHEPYFAYPEPEWVVQRPGMLLMGFAPNR